MLIGLIFLALTVLSIPLVNPVKFMHKKSLPVEEKHVVASNTPPVDLETVLDALTTPQPEPEQLVALIAELTPIPAPTVAPVVLAEMVPLPSATKTPTPKTSATPKPTSKKTPSPSPKATQTPSTIPTPTSAAAPSPVTTTDLESLFNTYGDEYKVDKAQLKRIALCESKLNTNAGNKWYAGLYQFSEGSWVSVRREMGLNTDASLRTNAEESIKTAAHMISKGRAHVWPNCK